MKKYRVGISGHEMEVEKRFVTGHLLSSWLNQMLVQGGGQPVNLEKYHNGVKWLYMPASGDKAFSKYYICDLEHYSEFVFHPVKVG